MRILVFLLFAVTVSTASSAQYSKFSLNVTGGYTFQDRVDLDAFYVKVKDGFQYGGSLEYFTSRRQSVELSYNRLDTYFPLYRQNGNRVDSKENKGAVNYILLGGNSYFPQSYDSKLMPFVGGGVGVGWFEGNNNSSAKFAFNIKAGAKIKTNSVVSFKVNAYLQSIVSTFGTDYWYGWYGQVYAVPDYATLWQFGLGGAICFDFKPRVASTSNP
jgi:hypothetical protein